MVTHPVGEGAPGQRALIPSIQGSYGITGIDVAANGDVVYLEERTMDFQHVVRWRDGALTQLAGPVQAHGLATDGIDVAYVYDPRMAGGTADIRLLTPGGPVSLATLPASASRSGDYGLRSGWIAFVRPDTAGELQVWERSSEGVETQISRLGSSSAVEAVAPDGQVRFLCGGQRYLGGPGLPVRDLGPAQGRIVSLGGAWHVILGGWLYRPALP